MKYLIAFFRRNLLIEISYRFQFLLGLLGILFSLTMFFFISSVFGSSATLYLSQYGGNYFPFVIIGMAFNGYFLSGLFSISNTIRDEQIMGTLESLLTTPISPSIIIIASLLWNFITRSIEPILFLLLGVLIFNVRFYDLNITGLFLAILFSILSFAGFGMLGAGFILIFKRGEPVAGIITSLSTLLGGVYYPIEVLPNWLQKFAYLLPITYSLRAIRYSLLQKIHFVDLLSDIIPLIIFTIITIPLGYISFIYALNKAKRDGTLTHY